MNGFWMLDSDGAELAFVTRFRVAVTDLDDQGYEVQGLREDNGEWMTLACYPNRVRAVEALETFGANIGAKTVAE